jgi:ribose-phosphate pyrophosphokinase
MPEGEIMLIVALPGGAHLAASLAQSLQCDWTELALHTFPDGETLVRIDAPVKGRCIVLAGSLHHPDEKTLPMLFAADTARELGASMVGLVAPYLAYLRQDRRFNAGEAITSRSYARLLSTSLDFLVTVDPHLHRWRSLGELYPIRSRAVASAPAIAAWLKEHVKSPLLIGPDSESTQWVAEVGQLTGAPWTVMSKARHGDREVVVKLQSDALWPGRTPVLLDDIVSTGHTLLAATRALKQIGMPPPLCIGVHALFEADALWRLLSAGVAGVVSCDTIPHASNSIALGSLLAQAVRELASETPPRSSLSHDAVISKVIEP